MKRGKRFFENDNLLIYGGTAIFFILAISIGIIMYMTTKTNKKDNVGIVVEENKTVSENTESASTNIGKTVEEQEKNIMKEEFLKYFPLCIFHLPFLLHFLHQNKIQIIFLLLFPKFLFSL